MPHIVLENASSVKECYDAVNNTMQKIDGGILKITDKYLNESQNSALIESIAVENGSSQNFFIQLSSKKDSTTVRLLPQTDPIKTDGVKTLMAIVADNIKKTLPNITYGKTNLNDFLID